ncbi:enoyl-CoA delta isomerase 2, peroxisomal-like [Aristolochia californica]|uniref:enoyl-CoA delta isomerase 2, peroxisomal-like n=1 Tax=Aristolochia californica TaxID=171875 RepID=UPI0035D92A24
MCTLEKRGRVFVLTLTGDDEHRLGPSRIDKISAALQHVRASSTPGSVLVTTAEGKFFSNGFDLDWARASGLTDRELDQRMGNPFERHIMAELLSLPIPTIAAVTGHAAAAGFVLALCHDYVFMRKDRGFLYMSELDISLPFPDSFMALMRDKIGNSAARRNVVLRAAKIKATEAAAMGIIEAACESAEETVKAAMRLAEELVGKKWDGDIYGSIRKGTLRETSEYFGLVTKGEKPGIMSRL